MSKLMMAARYAALARLFDQVTACGADGVVGVRLELHADDHDTEFVAMGTAVRRRGDDGAEWRDGRGIPFTSNLSGQDFWALVRAGFRPVSIVHGICCYQLVQRYVLARQNQEDPQATQAYYEAREIAMDRLQREGEAAGGIGVVQVRVEEALHGWGGAMLEFAAVGTAIAPIVRPSHEVHAPPRPVLFMDELSGPRDRP
jgi:uncharacterized protein YbjQ (UPF0145 family)